MQSVAVHFPFIHYSYPLFTSQATAGHMGERDIITTLVAVSFLSSYTELVESALSDVKAAMDTMVCCQDTVVFTVQLTIRTLVYISFHIVCCITAKF